MWKYIFIIKQMGGNIILLINISDNLTLAIKLASLFLLISSLFLAQHIV